VRTVAVDGSCTLFIQSRVKQHAELFLLLGMITPLGWLERVPTYKEQQEQLKEKDLHTFGFLGYPVLQTADVALYAPMRCRWARPGLAPGGGARDRPQVQPSLRQAPQADPGGAAPVPHRRAQDPRLDGRKMSKSYGNAVELGEDPESARKRIMVAVTDPARKRRNDPGHPEVCPIYWLHRAYSPPQTVELVDRECRTAGIGCVDCKKMLLQNLIPALEKHRAARAELDRNPGRVDELVQLGIKKATAVAEQTMTVCAMR